MSYRLSNIERSLVPTTKTRLEAIRERIQLDPTDLRTVLFGAGRFEKYLAPLWRHISVNREIYSHHHL